MGGKRYAGLDRFRLVAAVLVVAIHTAPLSDLSETLDFFVTYCAGRLAVPFFLLLTGYCSEAGAVAGGDPLCGLRLPRRRIRRQLVRACERRTRAARGL